MLAVASTGMPVPATVAGTPIQYGDAGRDTYDH
jgi:hypothetical protein